MISSSGLVALKHAVAERGSQHGGADHPGDSANDQAGVQTSNLRLPTQKREIERAQDGADQRYDNWMYDVGDLFHAGFRDYYRICAGIMGKLLHLPITWL